MKVLSLGMDAVANLKPKIKPFLRGHFHQAAFFFSLGACLLLLTRAHEYYSVISAIVYSFSLCGLFGVSALYHRMHWKQEKIRDRIGRVDHSFIFILIAGTSMPVCLLTLSPEQATKILTIIWIAALIGIFQALFFAAPKWVSAILYVFVGWLAVPYLPEFRAALGPVQGSFLLAGGII
ncbi:MAG: hemolysin III family protein, partial [Pseudobdellovibrionaceae bacterium]